MNGPPRRGGRRTETSVPVTRIASAQDDAHGAAAHDPDSARWLADLRGPEPARAEAVGRLRALLMRAAEFEVARRQGPAPDADGRERIAREAAESALAKVLGLLDDFRGGSRFSTWAAKFALLEAAVMVRAAAWDGRPLPGESDAWARLAGSDGRRGPDHDEAVAALGEAIRSALSEKERAVIVALALNGVPIDVLAQRLGTSRGAIYETLRTARGRLRAHLV
jgi:RNA polymerase sigma-70 factor (ECF subfamily)